MSHARAQRLRRHQPHQQRPGQPGPIRHRHRVEIGERDARLRQRLVDHRQNPLDMRPRGDLRHHAAEPLVQPILRRDDRRQHFKLIGDHRRRGFVAGRFDGENLGHVKYVRSQLSWSVDNSSAFMQLTTDHGQLTKSQMMHPSRRHVRQHALRLNCDSHEALGRARR